MTATPATITRTIGQHEITLPVLRSAAQKLRYLREYYEAVERYQALPEEGSLVRHMEAVADLEIACATGILRMLPQGHPWRKGYDANTHQAADEPWRGYGDDLLEVLQAEGIGYDALRSLVEDMLTLGGTSPTAAQVEEARGNSDATQS